MSFQKRNIALADNFNRLADLTDIDGGSFWSIKAYRNAADTIRNLDVPVSSIGDLTGLPGIGKGISKKISEYLKNGYIKDLVELESVYPIEALTMTVVPGIGAKTAFKYHSNGIKNFEELVSAADKGLIKNENIMRGIKLAVKSRGRFSRNEIMPVVSPIIQALRESEYVIRAEFAGSVRRGKETVKDVDILVSASNKKEAVKLFQFFGEELVNGEDKSRIIAPVDAHTSVQVDLLFCPENEFGSALAYFTGSKEHNIAIRILANKKGMKVNEHGFWCLKTGKRLGGREEIELYELLGIPFCPPELREGDSLLSEIPDIISRADITTDWHMHTTWSSDAKNSFKEMAVAAKSRGLSAIGVSDHTEKQYGWNPELIEERRREAAEAELETGIKIYAGCETGINQDGSLDWPDEYLDKMDFVIASIHKSHNKSVTERLISAAKHPMVNIIGHPTGRIIGRRDIPEADWKEVFRVCKEEDVLLEINGARIDLSDSLIRLAKSVGCKFVISSDAHSTEHFIWQDTAIITARRAGLVIEDLEIPKVER